VQLAETLGSPEIGQAACARFVDAFIRPRGRGVAATPILADALERLALSGPLPPRRTSILLYPLRVVLWCAGVVALYGDGKRTRGELRKRVAGWVRPFTAR
jgi:hypothetical protein